MNSTKRIRLVSSITVLMIGLLLILNCCSLRHYQLIERELTSTKVPGYSNMPEDTRIVYVIVPPGYDEPSNSDKEYPTVYVLHGAGQGRENIKKLAEFVKDSMYNLSCTVEDMIVVVPHAGTNLCGDPLQFECSSFYTNSTINGDFRDYIVNDVVEFVDSNFRTLEYPSKRALTGFSMGGYGAMMLAMKSNGIDGSPFSSVVSHSGILSFESLKDDFEDISTNPTPSIEEQLMIWYMHSLMIPAIERAFCPNEYLNVYVEDGEMKYNEVVYNQVMDEFDPITYFLHNTDALNGFNIYIDCGKNDELNFAEHAEKFRQTLIDEGTPVQYYKIWETGEDLGLDLPDWFSGHSLIHLRIGESMKFHSDHF